MGVVAIDWHIVVHTKCIVEVFVHLFRDIVVNNSYFNTAHLSLLQSEIEIRVSCEVVVSKGNVFLVPQTFTKK